jgi:ketosteroid isomerase-like protein
LPGRESLDKLEIEQLTRTYVWAVDARDRELFLSLFSDDIEWVIQTKELSYIITGIEQLKKATDFILSSEKGKFSSLSNLLVEIKGNTATGQDYYEHYGYRVDSKTGGVEKEPTITRGRHFWEFRKQSGVWKVTRMEVREHGPAYPECEYAPFTPFQIPK